MALAMAGIPATRRISDEIVEFSDGAASLADLVFGFFEEGQDSSESSSENSFRSDDYNNDDGDEDENPCNVEENKAFWKEQEQLLKVNFDSWYVKILVYENLFTLYVSVYDY